MYPAYAKWVQSHRDLPIKLNQWCNIVVSYDDWQLTAFLMHRHLPHLLLLPHFLSEMGVQTPAAFPEDKGVPVAGGTHGVRHQRGGNRGGNASTFTNHV